MSIAVGACALGAHLSEATATKLLRFPDVHEDRVVFTYGGDLWTVSTKGGTARRLTAHPGVEVFAKYSPDGRWIAFTGQYAGDEQVFVMPADGGEPTQLTYYPAMGPLPARWGYDHQVQGWTPDGKSVLFRGLRDHWAQEDGRLYTVPRDGGLPVALTPPVSGAGTLSPDGRRLLYSPLFRDFRTWKRYQGGWAQDLYIFDLDKGTSERLTVHPRTDRDPMWVGDELVFASDRDGRLNLFRRPQAGGDLEQLTRHKDWDVRWPSASPDGQIVYELAGGLRIFRLSSGQDVALEIDVPGESLPARPRTTRVDKQIEAFELSPGGSRALFVARGDLFDAPTEHGLTRNLTGSSEAHDREAQWSMDGKRLVFVSDRSGEENLWVLEPGLAKMEPLLKASKARLYRPRWSPKGDRIAFGDHTGKLSVVEVKSGRVREIAQARENRITDYRWSPYGGHLAFSAAGENGFHSIYIWTVGEKAARQITSETFHEHEPVWAPDGEHLFFLADHDFRAQLAFPDFNYLGTRKTSIYAFALRRDVAHPFPPRNDRDEVRDPKKDSAEKKEEPFSFEALRKKPAIKIEFDGLGERVARVPTRSGNYSNLSVTDKHVLFLESDGFYIDRPELKRRLIEFDRKEQERRVAAKDVQAYVVSARGSHALFRTKEGFRRMEIGKKEPEPEAVSTDGLKAKVDPRKEWANIFHETWRRFRDHFYVANMHGVNWDELRSRYGTLLPDVAHRSDLNYLLGEMIGELNVSHAYVSGGDEAPPPRAKVALPGARFAEDAEGIRISKIFKGENTEDMYRVPLREVGVDARVGDYVLAVNGRPVGPGENLYARLRLPLDRPVELVLNERPRWEGARTVVFRPRASEKELIYHEWVASRRSMVEEATDGEVGYLHLPDMMGHGLQEFNKWYYPQLKKRGLIVDARGNGGGFVSGALIRRLQMELLGVSFSRHDDVAFPYPGPVMVGPKVCLLNETSASDGDIFPWAFREAGIGPLIGKKSWGGVVGITDHGPLIDGGSVFVPEFSTNDAKGAYIIEGQGVEPDIEVDNPPEAVLAGKDPQLERGIEEIQKLRRQQEDSYPERPADPMKAALD